MKQSAAKTLGVAALGAAFAAAGAGAATAAPAVPDALPALDAATQNLPAEKLSGALPDTERAVGATQPVTGMLGGMPLQGSVNGFPIG
ncbi:ATP-binding protein [Streptomyces sp. NPDC085927]|uniref:ATP-binding protein n=1 Tax=Streptomyces sp. NPDC085927 TaxID=3365738 RepID=UPI0037D2750A